MCGTNTPVDVVVRPEDIRIIEADKGMIKGIVESVTFKGVHYEMEVRTEEFTWLVHSTVMSPVGEHVGLLITPEDIHIMRRR